MNTPQKIFVMVAVGSLAVLLITIFAIHPFTLTEPFISAKNLGFSDFADGKRHINWFGMIAFATIVVSITGFFLFKDK